MQEYIRINPLDNVAVALRPLAKGHRITLSGLDFSLPGDVSQGHKFTLAPIKASENIIKYGNPIGHASVAIAQGEWVHTHNLKTNLGEVIDYNYQPSLSHLAPTKERFFEGFRRSNGTVGVRNEIWIIPTVGCINSVATAIERKAKLQKPQGVDDIVAFCHPYGCSQMGDDQENTRKILTALMKHPNAGGVLVLGLGCENSGIDVIKEYLGEYDPCRIKFLACQQAEDEIGEAMCLLDELGAYAGGFKREKINVNELIIGLKCGGSDGLSGITANPTIGEFSDILISKGGSTILTEVPEMFGAESLLMSRAKDPKVFEKIVTLINDFKHYFTSHNQTIYENPSPGNKSGGISTLEDKSLGCTQKSGTATVVDVINYGDSIKTKGLNLLSGPGNDLVSTTALAAAGAHIVLFSTGRGTPFSCPVPTVKIATNTALVEKKSGWIDFNCGVLVEGTDMDTLSEQLFEFVLDVASGKLVKSEEAGYHEMAIFKEGVTL